MGATLTTVAEELQEHVHDHVTDVWFNDKQLTPLMAHAESKAMDDGMGAGFRVPIVYDGGASVSAGFSSAQGISDSSLAGGAVGVSAFLVQAVKQHATARWSLDTVLQAKGDPEKLFEVMAQESEGKIVKVRNRLAMQVSEDGWGRVIDVQTPTLAGFTGSLDLVNRVNVGERLVFASSESGATLRSATGNRVTEVDDDTGIIKLASNPLSDSVANGDVAFFLGDRENSATPTRLCITGLKTYNPTSSPSTTLWGATRAGIRGLSGIRYNAQGLDIAQALLGAATRLNKNGSIGSECFISIEDWLTLAADKDAAKVMEVTVGKLNIGFSAITITGPHGQPIKVFADSYFEQGTGWMGPFSDKKYAPFFVHNDDLVNIDDTDGNTFLRKGDSTDLEMRLYFRGNYVNPAPGKFCTIYNLGS